MAWTEHWAAVKGHSTSPGEDGTVGHLWDGPQITPLPTQLRLNQQCPIDETQLFSSLDEEHQNWEASTCVQVVGVVNV